MEKVCTVAVQLKLACKKKKTSHAFNIWFFVPVEERKDYYADLQAVHVAHYSKYGHFLSVTFPHTVALVWTKQYMKLENALKKDYSINSCVISRSRWRIVEN